jgi:Asp-tRNA(Asn)/Glu-tRNA(Gln) amidotransferase A subunit family amidase
MASSESLVAASRGRADALQDMCACDIVRRIAGRELSARETVEYFIARLTIADRKLNAVTTDLSESARNSPEQSKSNGEARS